MGLLKKSPVKVTRKASRIPYVWLRRRRRSSRRRRRSQALLSQGGGHLVGQSGQLRGVGHVDAARGRHSAQLLGGVFQRDDLSAVVGAGFGRLAEGQFVALNLWDGSRLLSVFCFCFFVFLRWML